MPIRDILEAGERFRAQQPEPGSVEMVRALSQLVEIYDGMESIVFSKDEADRNTEVYILNAVREIKRDLLRGDYTRIRRKRFLYS